MLIVPIVYEDGMMDQVDPQSLQVLIEEEMIVKFQRGEGWVYVGVDPVRTKQRPDYPGPERRHMH
ncbi:GSU3473 family protein [Pelovirga terrestris]|uniref:Uncharacterized protein n=1 Tax=Pelovirga terrestris TaxID=2771352 RepID=A0A8J6UGD8_9BACT|nr:hypothetical protein [Pelovirga terrestris]MBD1399568.1 hypothetical protein [Pelovirga terrestris]